MPTLLTVGHSTRAVEDFLGILKAHGVERLVDIRTVPRSRHNPQFSQEALQEALRKEGIAYTHLAGLGGLRHSRKDSINTAWRNASFRGYADYMQTEEFARSLDQLIALAAKESVAIMCAEAVPWRCHRSLVADALAARGIPVEHITSAAKREPHSVTPFAVIEGARVTYPGRPEQLELC